MVVGLERETISGGREGLGEERVMTKSLFFSSECEILDMACRYKKQHLVASCV
jgi:hypothetical protein